MDLKRTGEFIKERRKAKNLTQADLAEKIYVSEKTISKWECGNGFPDTSLILPLCQALDINANELLSGKKLDEAEYKHEAEHNLLTLQRKQEDSIKFILTLEIVIGFFASIILFTAVMISSFIDLPTWIRILIIVIGFIIFIIGIHFCLLIEKDAGFYECKHCGCKHIPTYKQVLWSMHSGRTRFIKCPKCNKKSWQKKVIK